ncbi:hypothetical protein [Microaceticoccus formicicus]|uniref:hypothetical protein n=1 Tax=Microaceticoccus formicicus TaxID=3118105 RepID=UPI003CD033B4|nr:hypothetical protein VZL98_01510 [Peptoniphilaceae bacterium AMB_02]
MNYDRLLDELIHETKQLAQKATHYSTTKENEKEREKWAHRSMIYSFALLNLKDRENAKLILKMVNELTETERIMK